MNTSYSFIIVVEVEHEKRPPKRTQVRKALLDLLKAEEAELALEDSLVSPGVSVEVKP